jgi:alpha,alpha-trehalose phosphorylase (configuration-retaining)
MSMPLGLFQFCAFHLPAQYIVLINRYVPNASPSVFRTTKNNHNILQGVSHPDLRLTQEAKDAFDAWILKNGLRWTAEGGPLAPGGVDICIIG